jgi:hypothetical protein
MQQFFSLLSWRLFTAQNVLGVFPPIIRSSMTAVAVSGFTFVTWWHSCCVCGRAGRPLHPSAGTPQRSKCPSHRLIPDIRQGAVALKSQSLDPGGPEYLIRYSNSLRDGRPGDRIPVRARFSAPVQTGPGTHPASYTMGTGSFPGVKRPGRGVDHPPPPVLWLKQE